MNERLNELRIQAGIGRLEDGPWLVVIDKEANVIDPLIGLEKFAELIVKECIDACYKANEIRNIVPPTQEQVVLWCVDEIERKFGVK